MLSDLPHFFVRGWERERSERGESHRGYAIRWGIRWVLLGSVGRSVDRCGGPLERELVTPLFLKNGTERNLWFWGVVTEFGWNDNVIDIFILVGCSRWIRLNWAKRTVDECTWRNWHPEEKLRRQKPRKKVDVVRGVTDILRINCSSRNLWKKMLFGIKNFHTGSICNQSRYISILKYINAHLVNHRCYYLNLKAFRR